MISKSKTGAQVKDWITPSHVEIIRVKPPAERLEWLARRAEELKAGDGFALSVPRKEPSAASGRPLISVASSDQLNMRRLKRHKQLG